MSSYLLIKKKKKKPSSHHVRHLSSARQRCPSPQPSTPQTQKNQHTDHVPFTSAFFFSFLSAAYEYFYVPRLTVCLFFLKGKTVECCAQGCELLGGLTLPGLMMMIRQNLSQVPPFYSHHFKGAKEESDWYSPQSADMGRHLSSL